MDSVACISCREEATGPRHALQCDDCDRWQHRLCGTGMLSTFIFLYSSCLWIETVDVDSNPKKLNSKNLFRRNVYFPSFFNQYARHGMPCH